MLTCSCSERGQESRTSDWYVMACLKVGKHSQSVALQTCAAKHTAQHGSTAEHSTVQRSKHGRAQHSKAQRSTGMCYTYHSANAGPV